MRLYRITRSRLIGDVFSGKGAELVGSRWSSPGKPVIYCASSPESALTELRVWNEYFHTLQDLLLGTLDVPDHISRLTFRLSDLPHVPAGDVDFERTRALGDEWLQAKRACMLVVPSRLIPDKYVYILNPRHRDFEHVTVLDLSPVGQPVSEATEPIDRRRVFLCHASEDKAEVVRPVKEALFSRGINSWIDEAEITLGDSITQKVNQGLAKAEFVLVFISPAFVRKPWPKRELNAALNREARTGRKVVIPIVIHYDAERVDYASFLPLAEDKVYGVWDGDADRLATQIERAIEQVEG